MGCGRIAPKRELLRLAVADPAERGSVGSRHPAPGGLAVLDRAGTMGGRGAYLCGEVAGGVPDTRCLTLAMRRRAIPRALRRAVRIDPELVESVGR